MPLHRLGLLDSMRARIVLAVVLLLAGSAAVSIAVLRSVLLDRLDEQVRVDLRQEVEEFDLLRSGLDPRTGEPFADLRSIFDIYFAREVPDEGETLLAFVDGPPHPRAATTRRPASPTPSTTCSSASRRRSPPSASSSTTSATSCGPR